MHGTPIKMTSKPKVAIIILNWNGKKDTLACLHSVAAIDYLYATVVVVDNGSSDGSAEAIRSQFPSVILIENSENLGFAEGNNVGIRFALQTDAELILLLNNDTIVDPQILNAFTTTFATYPQAGILGAKIYLYDQMDTLDHWGGMWNPSTAQFDLIGLRQKEESAESLPQLLDYVCGAALIARRSVFEQIGLLEPQFFLIWEESDFCFRARRAGFATMTCPKACIYHKVSASFVGKPHSTYFWWRNRLLWIERNCSRKERIKLYWNTLIPDIAHLLKIRLLKVPQLAIRKKLHPYKDYRQQEEKLLKNKAALHGVLDYTRRRFGNGPSWLWCK
jgi:GT2 family glycosyltransferase